MLIIGFFYIRLTTAAIVVCIAASLRHSIEEEELSIPSISTTEYCYISNIKKTVGEGVNITAIDSSKCVDLYVTFSAIWRQRNDCS